MNDYKNFCEYVTKPQPTAEIKMKRALLITMYTLFTLLYVWFFWLNLKSWAMLILLPFIIYAMIRVTWRLVCIEYEFAIEAGELKVALIYGGSSRRTKRRVNISDMTLIAPYTEAFAGALQAPDIVECRHFADEDSENAYFCVWNDKASGKKKAIVIETNEEIRRILHLGNPGAFRK